MGRLKMPAIAQGSARRHNRRGQRDDEIRYDNPATLFENAGPDWVVVMARLRQGVSREQAQARLAPMFASWERTALAAGARGGADRPDGGATARVSVGSGRAV